LQGGDIFPLCDGILYFVHHVLTVFCHLYRFCFCRFTLQRLRINAVKHLAAMTKKPDFFSFDQIFPCRLVLLAFQDNNVRLLDALHGTERHKIGHCAHADDEKFSRCGKYAARIKQKGNKSSPKYNPTMKLL
jgi:hypothetical protein